MEHPRTVRVAAVQAASVAYDLHKSMHKLRSLVFTAKDNGAEIVVFPEAFLSAYPRHLDFRIGSRSQADRDWYGRYVKVSRVGRAVLAAGGVVAGACAR